MCNITKLCLLGALLGLAACGGSSSEGAAGGSDIGGMTDGDSVGETMPIADKPMGSPLPPGPIETPAWAELEQTVIVYE